MYREHLQCADELCEKHGLSLCVQGTYVGKPFHFSFKRFIPVCTGNIFAIKFLRNEMAVYPCVYREHLADVALLNIERGLSLCVQGTYQL